MITKAQVKEIRALATSKGRKEHGAFVADGDKLAREWLRATHPIKYIVGVGDWLDANRQLIDRHPEAQAMEVSLRELEHASGSQAPNAALIVAPVPPLPAELPRNEWCIVLDTVQDPGNVGTIIRIADWFGIRHVVCSPGCADYYNPKVVAAAMGGHLRVSLHVADLPSFLRSCTMPVLAATLGGTPVQSIKPPEAAALIIGNESRGISTDVLGLATSQVTIVRRGGAESLNAAVSAGILISMLVPG